MQTADRGSRTVCRILRLELIKNPMQNYFDNVVPNLKAYPNQNEGSIKKILPPMGKVPMNRGIFVRRSIPTHYGYIQ